MEGVPFSSSLKVMCGLGGPGLWSAYLNVFIELNTLYCRNLAGKKGLVYFESTVCKKKKNGRLASRHSSLGHDVTVLPEPG